MSALLSVETLTRRFGGLVAVNGVTLDLRLGEVHAVIGTNGAGKSTLINMLSGEIGASEGRIALDGQEITGRSQAARARSGVGRSYQRTTIFPEFTVHENCRLAAQAATQRPWAIWQSSRQCKASNAAAREALEAAGLADVEVAEIVVPTVFTDFDDYWSPFLAGGAPAPAYVQTLPDDRRDALRDRLRSSLPTDDDGTVRLSARAWAVRGAVA